MVRLLTLIAIIGSFTRCEFDYEQLKPESFGEVGSVTIIMNTNILDTDVGKHLKTKMDKKIYGTYPVEKVHKTYYVPEESKSNATNRQTELVVIKIVPEDTYATPKVDIKYNLYVTNQIIITVTVNNLKTLDDFILEGWDRKVLAPLQQYELDYINKRTKSKRHKSSQKSLDNRFGINMVLPNDFVVNEDEKDFIWMTRKETRKTEEGFTVWIQQGILVWQVDYLNESQFDPDSLLAQRDSVLMKKVPYEKKKGYMATEYMEGFAPINKVHEDNGLYKVDLSGMWKVDGDPAIHMGGAFYQTSFYNQKTGKLVTVCAYQHAPGVSQRKLHLNMRAWVNSISLN
ncbi:MAG: DUF4837 family protein [Crocinitomicaceae bacterium]